MLGTSGVGSTERFGALGARLSRAAAPCSAAPAAAQLLFQRWTIPVAKQEREFPSAISSRGNSRKFKVNTASGVSSELLSSFILYSLSEQSPKGGYSIFFPTNLIAVHNLLAFAVYSPEVCVS